MRPPLVAALLPRTTFPPPGTSVHCGVSGGPDSLALLVLAVAAGCEVTAVHVDHGLRPGSREEGEYVAAVAAELGARSLLLSVDVPPGPNLQARARAARYAVLPEGTLVGHTADDQAETVLVNLLRGAGIDGLAGMDRATRPLLSLRRRETRELCAAMGLRPVQDPSNEDPRFLRARIRRELLPLLDDLAQRDVAGLLTRQADLVRSEGALLDQLAAAIDPTSAAELRAAPEPLARRAVRRWLRLEHPPDQASVDRVLAVARGEHRAAEVVGGRRVERHRGRLVLLPAEGRPAHDGTARIR